MLSAANLFHGKSTEPFNSKKRDLKTQIPFFFVTLSKPDFRTRPPYPRIGPSPQFSSPLRARIFSPCGTQMITPSTVAISFMYIQSLCRLQFVSVTFAVCAVRSMVTTLYSVRASSSKKVTVRIPPSVSSVMRLSHPSATVEPSAKE